MDEIREETKTELSRLGSSKSLYADTEGEMEEKRVRQALAKNLYTAAETFEEWASEGDGAVADLFADIAETTVDYYETVADGLDDYEPDEPVGVVTALDDFDEPAARVGGYIGWALVTAEKVNQAVGFFIGQAAPQTADDFRTIDDGIEADISSAHEVVTTLAADGDETAIANTASAAGVRVIEAAYEAYFETLEELGVNPKPVC